ncbi:MAG: glutathione S-transferase N-terminal domain-containing protein [Gammaproteobacteria bacterium]|nr:glutathione S-transferase N-terminal domain-containing protein [Gammaproteobacteria bacterium]MDH5652478.1 glutathione S-transferase N-terminal domain-containing protein [Gammaproteobacteria bacterium]
MKVMIRLFFRLIRRIVGPIMLFIDWITTPRGVQRDEKEQEKIDLDTQNLTLYQFKTCPFCIKVRRHAKRLSLNIETRDAQHDPISRTQLLTGGGEIKVPCLKLTNEAGEDRWMYESREIIHYLDAQFGAAQNTNNEQHATRH